ncbi:MAG TPA: HepT-like ribonuclease domain-containing protein [Thermoanaerobaculia bacterium]|nr:HepT-like ribonuclease domain-containing protein [Thermoanaerobaculia bacterium]
MSIRPRCSIPPPDIERLRHIVESAERVERFIAGRMRADLEGDDQLALAIVKSIEMVGEAAAHVGIAVRAELPEIPWPKVVGMRNHLIHSYFDIDNDRVWDTATEDLPKLKAIIERYLNEGAHP